MKRRVMANLRFETPGKRDTFGGDLTAAIDALTTVAERHESHGEDEEGRPISSVDVSVGDSVEGDDLYAFIKGKMENIPVITGEVHAHDCTHDDADPQPCVPDTEYSK